MSTPKQSPPNHPALEKALVGLRMASDGLAELLEDDDEEQPEWIEEEYHGVHYLCRVAYSSLETTIYPPSHQTKTLLRTVLPYPETLYAMIAASTERREEEDDE